jgi:hypothetical protein
MSDLILNTRLLSDAVRGLDADIRAQLDDLGDAFRCLGIVDEAVRDLAMIKRVLENRLGAAMAQKRYVVMGVGVFVRTPYRPGRHKCTDEDALWRAVLDTRVANSDGEILPQLDVVVHAYGSESRETGRVRLTGASPTKVEALGLDPDDFFELGPQSGWKIQVLR